MTEPLSEEVLAELRVWARVDTRSETLLALLDDHARQAQEIEAFREAVREGDGPFCEDVCQRSCIGSCGTPPIEEETNG